MYNVNERKVSLWINFKFNFYVFWTSFILITSKKKREKTRNEKTFNC